MFAFGRQPDVRSWRIALKKSDPTEMEVTPAFNGEYCSPLVPRVPLLAADYARAKMEYLHFGRPNPHQVLPRTSSTQSARERRDFGFADCNGRAQSQFEATSHPLDFGRGPSVISLIVMSARSWLRKNHSPIDNELSVPNTLG